ncbi:MAG: hypothetical protein A4S09_01350 [Proteobacteria bacterium SG_bin7]|nr:MAG: hypothetical protein A4S09_01350 [Proteobacteria bacterium SG_bin7]
MKFYLTTAATCTAIGPTVGLAALVVPFEYLLTKSDNVKLVKNRCETDFQTYLGAACPDALVIDTENRVRYTLDEYYRRPN